MSNAPGPAPDDEERALAHAWDWFSLHSGQRMQLLSFFFVAVTVLFAGYGGALDADRPLVAVGLCVGGLVFTAAFAGIDRRTRSLIKASEPTIAELEKRLGGRTLLPDLTFVTRVENARPSWTSYSKVIQIMLASVALLFIGGLIYGVTDAAATPDNTEQHCRPSESGETDPAPNC